MKDYRDKVYLLGMCKICGSKEEGRCGVCNPLRRGYLRDEKHILLIMGMLHPVVTEETYKYI